MYIFYLKHFNFTLFSWMYYDLLMIPDDRFTHENLPNLFVEAHSSRTARWAIWWPLSVLFFFFFFSENNIIFYVTHRTHNHHGAQRKRSATCNGGEAQRETRGPWGDSHAGLCGSGVACSNIQVSLFLNVLHKCFPWTNIDLSVFSTFVWTRVTYLERDGLARSNWPNMSRVTLGLESPMIVTQIGEN